MAQQRIRYVEDIIELWSVLEWMTARSATSTGDFLATAEPQEDAVRAARRAMGRVI